MITINNKTKIILSVSNNPGNFGATLYNYFFEKKKLNLIYLPFKFSDKNKLINVIKNFDLFGCSISMPFKNKIFKIVDKASVISKKTKSVNTIVKKKGKIIGHNTDVYGIESVLKNKKFNKILIIGNGSVVKSILYVFKKKDKKIKIFITSRNKTRLNKTIKDFKLLRYDKSQNKFDLVINATPIKSINEIEKFILFKSLLKCKLFFDLNVLTKNNEIINELIKKRKKYISGLEMTKYQFKEQFKIYTSKKISIKEINKLINKKYLNK